MTPSSFNQGTLTHVETGTLSDSVNQNPKGHLFFCCDAGDEIKVTQFDGTTNVYTAKNAGWQPYAVLRVWDTGTTIADAGTFQIGW